MITSLYAGLLALLYFLISLETIKARRRERVALGAGSENQIIHIVSAHSNFASYVPLFLILMILLDLQQANDIVLHSAAIVFFVGRVIHFLTMRNKEQTFKKRKLGMQLTLLPLVGLAVYNVVVAIVGPSLI